jgi:hypothetical protein
MSWDTVYSFSQFFAVLFAAVALVSGLVVNKRQGIEILRLRKAADDSKSAQQEVETNLAKAQEEAANTWKTVLELKAESEPRSFGEQSGAIKRLEAFAKDDLQVAILTSSDNDEVKNIAGQIAFLVRTAKWNWQSPESVRTDKASGHVFSDGIQVGTNGFASMHPEDEASRENATRAVDALIAEIKAAGLEASNRPVGSKLPYGFVVIWVGPKPSLAKKALWKKLEEEFKAKEAEINQLSEEKRKKSEAEPPPKNDEEN